VLHKAAWPITTAIAPLLVDKGADPSVKDSEGKLPLHWAAAVRKTSIVGALLERMGDDDVNKIDGEGATALIWGVRSGSLPLVRCLIKKWKAKRSVHDRWGNGAFYHACANGHILVATYLLSLGLGINEGNKEGNTPLHVVARAGHPEMVRLLLQLGAERSARSSQEAPGVSGSATPAEVASGARHGGIARMIETFELDDKPVWRVEMIEAKPMGS
jgi:ankyrin repeat protein